MQSGTIQLTNEVAAWDERKSLKLAITLAETASREQSRFVRLREKHTDHPAQSLEYTPGRIRQWGQEWAAQRR